MSCNIRVLLLSTLVSVSLFTGCSDESVTPKTAGDRSPSEGDDPTEDAPTDEEEDEGADKNEATLDAGKPSKIDAGKTGTDAGTKPTPGTDAGTKLTPGTDAGTKPGADAGAKPGTDAGTKPTPGTDAGPTTSAPASAASCVKKPSQVMIIGDSYINWPTHTLPSDLDTQSGQRGWRLEAVGGSSMNSGGIAGFIPDQFDASYSADKDVHTVVMDGGGNDILLADATLDPAGDCKNSAMSPSLPHCKKIVADALARWTKLLAHMADSGVRDVVYFFYPHIVPGTLLGGSNPNVISDYSMPMYEATCTSTEKTTGGKLRCHFVDMVPVFEGHDDWFVPGDVHPTPTGSAAMAKAIWKVMKDDCVGQTSAATCCAP